MAVRRKGHLTREMLNDMVDKLLDAVGQKNVLYVKRYVNRYANDVTRLCNTPGRLGFTAVTSAADFGFTEILQVFRKASVSLCNEDGNGWTALHVAVRAKRTNTVKYLLSHKFNVNLQNKQGYTPLNVAIRLGLSTRLLCVCLCVLKCV